MRAVATLFLGLTLAAGSVLLGQSGEVRNPHTRPADITAGGKTFRSHCAECHGLKGEGGRGPSLTTGQFFHGSSDAELLRNISNGIPGTEMPGTFYSPDRVWQLVAYVRSLSQASASPVKGDAPAGEKLVRSLDCLGCHRLRGEGGRMGPDLTTIGSSRSPHHLRLALTEPDADVRQRYWVVELVTDAGKKVSGFLMDEDTYSLRLLDFSGKLQSFAKDGLKQVEVKKTSKMPSYKDRFDARQLDDVVAFLSSLRPAKRGDQ